MPSVFRLPIAILFLAVPAAWARAQTTTAPIARAGLVASLQPAQQQDAGLAPYRQADLRLENRTAETIAAVLLRPRDGGPAIRQPLPVPQGGKATIVVPLPAMWPVQEYAVTALDAAGSIVGQAGAALTWPQELVATDAFIDDGFALWRGQPGGWPVELRRLALLPVLMLAALTGGVLLVRRPWLRTAMALGLLLTAGCLAWAVTFGIPDITAECRRDDYVLSVTDAAGIGRSESFVVISCPRTREFALRTAGMPYPVYYDRRAAVGENAVVEPADRSITLTLHPGSARVIRAATRDRPAFRVEHRLLADGRVSLSFPRGRAYLVRNDQFLRLPPGTQPAIVDPAEIIEPIGRLQSQLSEAGRLFGFWRKGQRPDITYVVHFPDGHVISMEVAELPGRSASGPSSQP